MVGKARDRRFDDGERGPPVAADHVFVAQADQRVSGIRRGLQRGGVGGDGTIAITSRARAATSQ